MHLQDGLWRAVLRRYAGEAELDTHTCPLRVDLHAPDRPLQPRASKRSRRHVPWYTDVWSGNDTEARASLLEVAANTVRGDNERNGWLAPGEWLVSCLAHCNAVTSAGY